jgi:hypothetical protein
MHTHTNTLTALPRGLPATPTPPWPVQREGRSSGLAHRWGLQAIQHRGHNHGKLVEGERPGPGDVCRHLLIHCATRVSKKVQAGTAGNGGGGQNTGGAGTGQG